MANLKNRQGGWLAKKIGASFENRIEALCSIQGISFIDIPDGCRRIGPNPRDLLQVKSPFDCIIGYEEMIFCLDLKTCANKSFPASLISPHQLKALRDVHYHQWAGYLIHFRSIDKIVFFDAFTLYECTKSLKPDDGFIVGDSLICDIKSLFAHYKALKDKDS